MLLAGEISLFVLADDEREARNAEFLGRLSDVISARSLEPKQTAKS